MSTGTTEPTSSADGSDALAPTDRTRLRRRADRGHFDRATIDAILDEALVAHVGFVVDGRPVVLPMAYGRIDRTLYLHGAAANAMLRAMVGAPACVTVTLNDGLVLARSTFHHSMNYRSVAIFGEGRKVEDPDEKRAALDAVVEHLVPGRTADARPPTDNELRATLVVALPIEEASAKVRAAGPGDEPDDLDLPVWAGVIPLATVASEPEPDADHPPTVPTPSYASTYAR